MIRILFLALLLAGCNTQPTVNRVDILGYGIYRMETTAIKDAPELAAGKRREAVPTWLVSGTGNIPGSLGVCFGFHYYLHGNPPGGEIPLTTRITFPTPGMKNPATGQVYSQNEYTLQRNIGQKYTVGYGFDHEWEIIEGKWTIQLWHRDRKLAEKEFMISKEKNQKIVEQSGGAYFLPEAVKKSAHP